ncbi:MAG: class C beta-lactamase-related serine hydrolase [Chloroflexota bacterium]|nr:MAG: class C beta-lactamase-related serine hydrolase [Chloroflexota bacterium]
MTMKTILRVAGTLIGIAFIFFAILLIAMSIFNSPVYAWRILRYGESDIADVRIFPERIIENGETYSFIERGDEGTPYEVEYLYQGELRKDVLEELLKRTGTRAFLILKDDRLIYETYLESSRKEVNTSFSTAKSFSSALIGAAIADGKIGSVNDPVIQYVPEIAGRGLDPLTVRDLLLMNSGIRYLHGREIPFYMAPFSDDALTYYPPDLRKVALSVEASGAPIGEAFRYNNYHMLLEGLIIERVTGMPVAEYLQEKIWKPMGAEFPASWSLDSEKSGFEKMESGINARAIDYARFGLIFLHNGYWNGVQILPESWVAESTQPLRPDPRTWETMAEVLDYGGYYKYHWWGINNADGTYDFHSHGKYDQVIYVAPRKNVVIVRLGNRLDENVTWSLVLHNIVDQMP